MIYTCTLNPAIDYRLVVDTLEVGKLNPSNFSQMLAGGKGINVSVVLNNIGTDNIAIGFLGGFTGEFLKSYISKELKLKSDFIEINDLTRINIKLSHDLKETEINQAGPTIFPEDAKRLLRYIQNLKKEDVLVCGGTKTRGVDDIYSQIAKLCNEQGIEFVVDATKKDLLDVLKFQPLLVKPNIHELEEFFQEKITTLEEIIFYGKKLLNLGAKNVIVSRGKDGSVFLNSQGTLLSPGLVGEVRNTVGAGDSMVAGFVSQYIQNKTSFECYRYAIACGSATAFSYNLATKDEINSLLGKIEINEVNEK